MGRERTVSGRGQGSDGTERDAVEIYVYVYVQCATKCNDTEWERVGWEKIGKRGMGRNAVVEWLWLGRDAGQRGTRRDGAEAGP